MSAVTGDYKLSPTEQNEWYQNENRRLEKKVNKYQEEIESMQRNDLKKENKELKEKLHEATTDAIAAKVTLQISLRTLRMQLSEREFEKYVNFTRQYMLSLGVMIPK